MTKLGTASKVTMALMAGASLALAVACGGGDSGSTTTGDATTTGTGTGTSTGTGMGAKGPGAGLMCKGGKNAWDTFGVDAFVKVNKSIFALTTAELMTNGNKNLGDSFSKVGTGDPVSTEDDFATFEGKLAAFLVWVYGGPEDIMYADGKMYNGSKQDLKSEHVGLKITQAQYDYFVMNVIVPALTMNGVSMEDVGACFAPIVADKGVQASIIGL